MSQSSQDPEAPSGPIMRFLRFVREVLRAPLYLAQTVDVLRELKDLRRESEKIKEELRAARDKQLLDILSALRTVSKKTTCPILESQTAPGTATCPLIAELRKLSDTSHDLLSEMRTNSDHAFNVKNNTDNICRVLNELQDRPIHFEKIIDQHPEFLRNPLDCYVHTHDNGNPEATPLKKTLIFLHMRRTAGTALTHIIRSNVRSVAFRKDFQRKYNVLPRRILETFRTLPKDVREEERRKWDRYDVLADHGVYGMHELLSRPFAYITMLRDPIDRLVSDYRYTKTLPPMAWTGERTDREKAAKLSLLEFIRDPYFSSLLRRERSYVQSIAGTREENITPQILEQAKKNLSTFEAVLITEEFDASVTLLCALYGWKDQIMDRGRTVPRNGKIIGNTTDSTAARTQLSDKEVRALEEFLKEDIELYAYGKQLFARQCGVRNIVGKEARKKNAALATAVS